MYTRSMRRADASARAVSEVLPRDVLSLVLEQLPLVRHIKGVARTCKAFRNAAATAEQAHRLVTFEHEHPVEVVVPLPKGGVVTGTKGVHGDWFGRQVCVWHGGKRTRHIRINDDATPGVDQAWAVALWRTCREERVSSGVQVSPLSPHVTLERLFATYAPIVCVSVLPDWEHIVVGLSPSSGDGLVQLYNYDGALVKTFDCQDLSGVLAPAIHHSGVKSVTATWDGEHIISAAGDGKLRVWNVASGSHVSTSGHPGSVNVLVPTFDNKSFLSAGAGGRVRLQTLEYRRGLGTIFQLHSGADITALMTLWDNTHALSGADDVTLFNYVKMEVVRRFTHHTGPVLSLAPCYDGRHFVSGSRDKTARIVCHGLELEPRDYDGRANGRAPF